jgi:hypothetical protein
VDWIDLAQDRDLWIVLVNAVMNLWVSQNAGELSSGYVNECLSCRAQLHRVSYMSLCSY